MTDFDKRSFIPTAHTLSFITQTSGENLQNDWVFFNSDQTGGMVMCDVYVSCHDSRVLVIGEEGFSVYPSLLKWHNEDGDYDYSDSISGQFEDYDDADYDEDISAFPEDNALPALWILAQLWTEEKYNTVLSGNIPDDRDREIIWEQK